MLYATVRNRKIHVKRPDTVVQNGVNVDWLELDMDDEWKQMDSIVCVFVLHYTEENTTTAELSTTTTITEKEVQKEMLHTFGEPVMVPWECLEHTGMLSVNCTGYVDKDGERQQIMTTAYPDSYWEVVQNGPVTGEDTLEPTPTLYDQIVAAAGDASAAAAAANTAREQLLQDRANGAFDGKDGVSTRVTVGKTVTGASGTSADVYQTGDDNNCVLNFTIPRGDPGPVPSALPNPYPLSLDIEGVRIEYDGSHAVVAEVNPHVDADWTPAINRLVRQHNEDETAHPDIREAIPEQLPNPHALSLNINGVNVEYDGSQPVIANIESTGDAGGSGGEDVSRAISEHNQSAEAHQDIRDAIPTVPTVLPNPRSLQVGHGLDLYSYNGSVNVDINVGAWIGDDIAAHNEDETAHEDIRKAIPKVPDTLPNPNKLTFTGAVNAEYDGSAAVTVEIPTGGGDGGGVSNAWNVVTELTLEEEMAVTLTVPEEAAGYTQWFACIAAPKGEAAKNFTKFTTFFGMSNVVNNVGIVSESFGRGVVVAVSWISGYTRGVRQYTYADFANTTPGFSETPRTEWFSPGLGSISDITDRSVMFDSKITLPAGTKLLFLGR